MRHAYVTMGEESGKSSRCAFRVDSLETRECRPSCLSPTSMGKGVNEGEICSALSGGYFLALGDTLSHSRLENEKFPVLDFVPTISKNAINGCPPE